MNKPINKYSIAFFAIIILAIAYQFIYKPYFTINGKIWREVNEENMLEERVLYYACALPKDHKYHKMLMKECDKLDARSEYESAQQNCSPDYMGGCN